LNRQTLPVLQLDCCAPIHRPFVQVRTNTWSGSAHLMMAVSPNRVTTEFLLVAIRSAQPYAASDNTQHKNLLYKIHTRPYLEFCIQAWCHIVNKKAQLSLTNPRDAKACQKLLQFDLLTTLSLTILVYLHSFSCCCVRNLRNPETVSENSNL